MNFYRDSVVQKSWELLTDLQRQYKFVLIGGWAVWLYTRQLKSKDIDIVVDLSELEKLKNSYDMFKNDRLKKYEFRQGEVEIDVYTSYFSNPGIPAEDIAADARIVAGFQLPSLELLLVLKIVAWAGRRASPKGRKDLIDIIGLLNNPLINADKISKSFKREEVKSKITRLAEAIQDLTSISELELNRHQTAKAKKRWLKYLALPLTLKPSLPLPPLSFRLKTKSFPE